MAQRKITEPLDLPDAASLPELTAQQLAFVKGILDGKNNSDAYRAAYDCSNMQPPTIWARASELRGNSGVAVWISHARIACAGSATVTLEGHLSELERLKELAIATGNLGAAVQAEQLRGKATGHYVEQIRDLTDYDPLVTLEQLAQHSPALAKQLADENGIAWGTQH